MSVVALCNILLAIFPFYNKLQQLDFDQNSDSVTCRPVDIIALLTSSDVIPAAAKTAGKSVT